MNLKDKVYKSLFDNKITDESKYDSFIETIKNDRSKEILEGLISIPEKEKGGRIALTGFYYQFLVFLEYWAEMLDGQWDFVALELHEDIVAGKDKKVRFIQVKSSKETEQRASTTISNRSVIKEEKVKKTVINDSWVDKLISKAKHFKKSDGFETEFELVTSFIILDSNNLRIGNYRTNKYPVKIEENDDLVNFMSKELRDRDGNNISYENESGESIPNLLSRFRISKRHDLDTTQSYENHILMLLSNHLGVGAKLTQEDLMMLIGRLMKMCYLYQDKLMLYISPKESEQILQDLDDIATKRAEEHTQLKGSFSFLEEVFANLTQQFEGTDLFEEVNKYIISYKGYIVDWINNGGTRRELINRYIDGNQYSTIYKTEHIDQQKKRLFDFFSINLLLILAHNDISRFSPDYKFLLVKEIKSKYVGFLSLNRGDRIDKAVQKAKYLLSNYEDFQNILNPPRTIIQGDFIQNRHSPIIKEVLKEEELFSELPEGFDIDKVNPVLHIIPGGILKDQFDNLFGYNEIEQLKKDLKSMWGELI